MVIASRGFWTLTSAPQYTGDVGGGAIILTPVPEPASFLPFGYVVSLSFLTPQGLQFPVLDVLLDGGLTGVELDLKTVVDVSEYVKTPRGLSVSTPSGGSVRVLVEDATLDELDNVS